MPYLKKAVLLALCCVSVLFVKANTYTAIISGNYNVATTWQNGNVPPFTIAAGDTVFIPAGITVASASDITFKGMAATSALVIGGELAMASNTLRLEQIILRGKGTVTADSLGGDFLYGLYFDGTVNVNSMDGSSIYTYYDITINIKDLLYVKDSMRMDNGKIYMAHNSLVIIEGSVTRNLPTLRLLSSAPYQSGHISGRGTYNVLYKGDKVHMGYENNSWVEDVTIDMNSSQDEVIMEKLFEVEGKLHIKKGILNLNAKNLLFKDYSDYDAGPDGSIAASPSSTITIEADTPLTAALKFAPGGNALGSFVNRSSKTVKLASNLTISAYANLEKGNLDIQGDTLTIQYSAYLNGDEDGYVITDGGGYVNMNLVPVFTGKRSALFPIGTATQYHPVLVTSGDGYKNVYARVKPGVKEHATTGADWTTTKSLVDATWEIWGPTPIYQPVTVKPEWHISTQKNGFDVFNDGHVSHYVPGKGWDRDIAELITSNLDNTVYAVPRDNLVSWGYFAVFDHNTVDVENVKSPQLVSVYPNPAKDKLHVVTEKESRIIICNTYGQQVMHSVLPAGGGALDIATLPAGNYFVNLQYGATTGNTSFIKQ